MDHVSVVVGEAEILDRKKFANWFDSAFIGGIKYYPKMKSSVYFQRSNGTVEMAAQFLFDNNLSAHIDNLKMYVGSILSGKFPKSPMALPGHLAGAISISLPLVLRYLLQNRSFKPGGGRARLEIMSEQARSAESRISLSGVKDQFGINLPVVDWRISQAEISSIDKFARVIAVALERAGVARVQIDEEILTDRDNFIRVARDTVHQMSTTRMATTAASGVVDKNATVFNMSNLHVAGAAIFPTGGFANPTLTAIALGLRLCDRLATS
jgi:hypothetical protein